MGGGSEMRRSLAVLGGAGLTAAALAVLVAARRSLLLVAVSGESMVPALLPGDRLLVRRGALPLRSGVIVLLEPPHRGPAAPDQPLVVKRVAALPGDAVPESVRVATRTGPGEVVPGGRLVVLGDGPVSADSRAWGFSSLDSVRGVAVARLPLRR